MTRLVLCAGCERHVRSDESACPFCGGALDVQPRALGALPMSRAAAVFLGATAVAACGKEPQAMPMQGEVYGPPPVDVRDAAPPPPPADAGRLMPAVPVYGPAPVLDDEKKGK